jgi:hypothetical protein
MCDGSYGQCRACDAGIPRAVLTAIPATTVCRLPAISRGRHFDRAMTSNGEDDRSGIGGIQASELELRDAE